MYNQNEYINEYLIKSFEDLGKTQAEVIEDLNKSQPYVSALMNGKKKVGKEIAKELSRLYGFDEGAILTGKINNNISIHDNRDVSHNTIIGSVRSLSNKDVVEEKDVVSYSKGIPYYNVDFINGFTGVEEITHQNAEYNIDYPPANHCQFWVNATGESMKGIIDNGDKIALRQVDTEWFPLGEVYAIVTTNGHRMVKKIVKSEDKECYKLVSANPNKNEYPDQDIPKHLIHTLFKVVTSIKFIN